MLNTDSISLQAFGAKTYGLFTNGLFTNGLFTNGLFTNGLFTNELFNDGLYNDGLYNDKSVLCRPISDIQSVQGACRLVIMAMHYIFGSSTQNSHNIII